jgi:hypothetical protein
MTRIKRLSLGAIVTAMILGSSLVVASQPADDEVRRDGPRIGGGLGHNLKK